MDTFTPKGVQQWCSAKSGSGLFTAAVARTFPLLPLEKEGRLNDPYLREKFIERVFSYRCRKDFLASGPTPERLVEFHTAHKLLMMAHSPDAYRRMGSLVAHGKELPQPELLCHYEELFMKGLTLHATTRKSTNVLQHMMGYFKKQLSPDEKAELLDVITPYHKGLVPMTLVRHYVRKYAQHYLQAQMYLSAQLMLRNHVC